MSKRKHRIRNIAFITMCMTAVFFSGFFIGGCEKKKEAVYTIGPENVPDLEKGEQEVKGEKAVNPLEATKEDETQQDESSNVKGGEKKK